MNAWQRRLEMYIVHSYASSLFDNDWCFAVVMRESNSGIRVGLPYTYQPCQED